VKERSGRHPVPDAVNLPAQHAEGSSRLVRGPAQKVYDTPEFKYLEDGALERPSTGPEYIKWVEGGQKPTGPDGKGACFPSNRMRTADIITASLLAALGGSCWSGPSGSASLGTRRSVAGSFLWLAVILIGHSVAGGSLIRRPSDKPFVTASSCGQCS
jgi:hypothetical protein